MTATTPTARDWSTCTLSELCDHIEQTHHAYLREEMPRLLGILNKIAIRSGEKDPRLVQLRNTFARFMLDMLEHMDKEEWYVFAAARKLDRGIVEPADPAAPNALHDMIQEHDEGGMALLKMRELTDGFRAPEDASKTLRDVLRDLEKLDHDMHEHVFKENCILALKSEQARHRLQEEHRSLQDVILSI